MFMGTVAAGRAGQAATLVLPPLRPSLKIPPLPLLLLLLLLLPGPSRGSAVAAAEQGKNTWLFVSAGDESWGERTNWSFCVECAEVYQEVVSGFGDVGVEVVEFGEQVKFDVESLCPSCRVGHFLALYNFSAGAFPTGESLHSSRTPLHEVVYGGDDGFGGLAQTLGIPSQQHRFYYELACSPCENDWAARYRQDHSRCYAASGPVDFSAAALDVDKDYWSPCNRDGDGREQEFHFFCSTMARCFPVGSFGFFNEPCDFEPGRCLGGLVCAPGYRGYLCALCEGGYYRYDEAVHGSRTYLYCDRCPASITEALGVKYLGGLYVFTGFLLLCTLVTSFVLIGSIARSLERLYAKKNVFAIALQAFQVMALLNMLHSSYEEEALVARNLETRLYLGLMRLHTGDKDGYDLLVNGTAFVAPEQLGGVSHQWTWAALADLSILKFDRFLDYDFLWTDCDLRYLHRDIPMTREQFYWLAQFFPYSCLLVAVFVTRALSRSSRPRLLRLAAFLLGSATPSSTPPPLPQGVGSNSSPARQPIFLRRAHPYAKIKDGDDDGDDGVTDAPVEGTELTYWPGVREQHVLVRLTLLVYSGATILFTRGAVLAAHDLGRGQEPLVLPVLILLASLAGLVIFTGGVFRRYARLFRAGAATKCQNPAFTARFGALIYPYRKNRYWWKATDLAKTASLALCIAFAEWNRLQLAAAREGQDGLTENNELETLCSEQAGDERDAHGPVSSPQQLGDGMQLSGLGLYITSLCLLISFAVVAARSRPYKHAACNAFASAWDWAVVIICANFLWDKIASIILAQKLSFLISESCLVSSLVGGHEQAQNTTQLVVSSLVRRSHAQSRYLRRIEAVNENTGLFLALVVLALGTAGVYLTFKAEQNFYASYTPADQPRQITSSSPAGELKESARSTSFAQITPRNSVSRHLPQDLLLQIERANPLASVPSPDDL